MKKPIEGYINLKESVPEKYLSYANILHSETIELIKFVSKEEEKWDFIDPLEIKDTTEKELTYSNPFDLFDYI